MREQLNNNPLAQLALLGALLLVGGFFFVSTMGGGGEEESEAPSPGTATLSIETATGSADVSVSGLPEGGAANAAPATAAPPLPASVMRAWRADQTVVLLFVRDGGIDDRLVKRTTRNLAAFPDAAFFIAPAKQIYRYGAIAEGVGVERVPALVVLRPRHLDGGVPSASVYFGFQSPARVRQAIIDAGYTGRTIPYHP